MPNTTADHPQTLEELRTRLSQFAEMARAMTQQAELLAAALARFESEPLPERAKVRIVGQVEDAPEVTGRSGIALAGGPTEAGWTYTVLVDGLDETYVLPRSVLRYSGEIVPEDRLYRGETVRVAVNEAGAGTVVKNRSRKKTRRK